jgi:hypothetical protein
VDVSAKKKASSTDSTGEGGDGSDDEVHGSDDEVHGSDDEVHGTLEESWDRMQSSLANGTAHLMSVQYSMDLQHEV